jgi:hypothetical protein
MRVVSRKRFIFDFIGVYILKFLKVEFRGKEQFRTSDP